MKHQTIEYYDGKQLLIGELIYNSNLAEPQSTVIVYPAFEGRGEFALQYGENLAQIGYNAFVADIYGEAQVAQTLEECIQLYMPFSKDRALVRRRAELAFLAIVENDRVNQNKIGAMGFCFGGMCALELARSGQNLGAVVTAHGMLEKSNLPTQTIKSKVLVLHGYKDPQAPPHLLNGFAEEMESAGVSDWTVTFFGGAKHSFTDPKTGTFDLEKELAMGREYHPIAAQRSFRYAADFFAEAIGPS